MPISKKLDIYGKKVLLAGFRSHQNMGDELIIAGNIKLLQEQKKEITIIAHDPQWLKSFLGQLVDIKQITFIQELPRGIRSTYKYLKEGTYKQFKAFMHTDTIILGGGEIFTEESPHSYYYRLWSIWPALFLGKRLYLMGGIQTPTKRYNKLLCKWIFHHTKKIFSRDKEEIGTIQEFGKQEVEFFMDTSYFAIDNRKKYHHLSSQKYIIININSKGLQYLPELCKEIIDYAKEGYTSTYISICKGNTDDDTKHFQAIQQMLPNMYKPFLQQKDRSEDFIGFIKYLGGAQKVISTRLHLFLISEFIGVETLVFPYQKKIHKMKKIITELKEQL